jgi:heme-degrading monooxygenase HmoA
MAFAVMNVVPVTPDKFPDLLAWFTSTGFEGLEAQAGFRAARFYRAEQDTEAVMITEWDSRDDFLAYRQSASGREAIMSALPWHPRISFFEIVAETDGVRRP